MRTLFFLLACLSFASLQAAELEVKRFGAVGDGLAVETAAIQKAIDECSRLGGGKVVLRDGRYVTGTIFLKNNVILHLDENATILGSTNIADYADVELFTEGIGQKMGWCLIGAFDGSNIGIEGPGTIDGRGKELNEARSPSEKRKRPVLLRFVRCDGVALSNLQLRSSAMWMAHFSRSAHVNVSKVTIRNHVAANNDGFDIDSCNGVRITDCEVDSGDDALCLKSTYPAPSRNVTVSHCKLKSDCAAIKMGTESLGGFTDVTITDCEVRGSRFGGINIFSVDGGDVRNISISNITMDKVGTAICLRLGARLRTFHEGDSPKPVGTMRGVTINNVRAKWSELPAIIINGIPGHRIEDVRIENLDAAVAGGGTSEDAAVSLPEREADYPESRMFGKSLPAYGLWARHVKGLQLVHCKVSPIKPDARPFSSTQDVESMHVDALATAVFPAAPPAAPVPASDRGGRGGPRSN